MIYSDILDIAMSIFDDDIHHDFDCMLDMIEEEVGFVLTQDQCNQLRGDIDNMIFSMSEF